MFRRMAGRCHYPNLECPQINDRLFCQGLVIESQLCFCAGADDRAGLMSDLAVAGDEVCVQVRIKDMRQLNPKLSSGMQVPVYVAQRVDQDPFFRRVGTNQIGRVAEPRIHKRFDEIICHMRIILRWESIRLQQCAAQNDGRNGEVDD